MKFCHNCGTKLRFSTHKPYAVMNCEKCGYREMAPSATGGGNELQREQKLEYRPWQPPIIERIVKSIKSGRRVILDAPTGSGKTLVALKVAERLLGDHSFRKAYIAVRTINEMVPYQRDMSRFVPGLRYKYLLGKRRGCPFYMNGDDNDHALCTACLKGNPPRMTVDPSAIMRDMSNGLNFLEKRYVKAISESKRNVVQNGVCLYQSMKEIPEALSLITYPYITNINISAAKVLDSLPDSLLIIDEAHNLESSSEVFTDKMSPKMIEIKADEMSGFKYKFGSEQAFERFTQCLGRLALCVSTFCNADGTTEHKQKEELSKSLNVDLKDDVFEIKDAYLKIEEERQELAKSGSTKKLPNPLFPIIDFISNFEELYEKVEVFAENGGISIKVLDPSQNLKILSEAGGLLLMSGTMPSKERIVKVWGLENVEEIRLLRDYPTEYYSVFPRENRETRVITTVTSKFATRGELTWSSYASIIEQVHSNNPKMTLVCCPSYSVAQNIYRQLSEEGREGSYLETRDTRVEEVFQKISDADARGSRMIVFGVARGKILEGVEFVKDDSSLVGAVVIAGIPYPIPNDVHRWRSKLVMERLSMANDKNLESEFFMNQPALIEVRQAIGRAIRFPNDRATIYLADSRFAESFWNRELVH